MNVEQIFKDAMKDIHKVNATATKAISTEASNATAAIERQADESRKFIMEMTQMKLAIASQGSTPLPQAVAQPIQAQVNVVADPVVTYSVPPVQEQVAVPDSATEEDPGYVHPDKTYDLQVTVDKPCDTCPVASQCQIKNKVKIEPRCGLDAKKRIVAAAGTMQIVVRYVNHKYDFLAYKDGEKIGNVHSCPENRLLRNMLRYYPNHVATVTAQLVQNRTNSIFTKLQCQIVSIDKAEEAPVVEEYVPIDESPAVEQESPGFDLGEMTPLFTL